MIKGEGMPMKGDPYTKGNLVITFTKIRFPDKEWTQNIDLESLNKLLPKRRLPIPRESEEKEEVFLEDFVMSNGGRHGQTNGMASDSDDEGHGHGQRVNCANQ